MKFKVGVVLNDLSEECLYKVMLPYGDPSVIGVSGDKLKYFVFQSITSEYIDKYKNEIKNRRKIYQKVYFKLRFPTFDVYMRKYCHEVKNFYANDYGYWDNPNAHWDYYISGGVGNKILLVDDSVEITRSEYFDWDNDTKRLINPTGYKWVNHCKIKDIAFNKIKELDNFKLCGIIDDFGWHEFSGDNLLDEFKKYIRENVDNNNHLIIVECHF